MSAEAVGVPLPGVKRATPRDGPGRGRSSVGFRGGAEAARDFDSSNGDGPSARGKTSSVGDGRLPTGATSCSTGNASQRLRLRSRLTGAAAADAAMADGTRARALLRGAGPAGRGSEAGGHASLDAAAGADEASGAAASATAEVACAKLTHEAPGAADITSEATSDRPGATREQESSREASHSAAVGADGAVAPS